MRTLVLIHAYNEEKNLERVIENLKKKAPQFDYIIINDGLQTIPKNYAGKNSIIISAFL